MYEPHKPGYLIEEPINKDIISEQEFRRRFASGVRNNYASNAEIS
jgi:hypothetical protein